VEDKSGSEALDGVVWCFFFESGSRGRTAGGGWRDSGLANYEFATVA
jgi:hypothetical protein